MHGRVILHVGLMKSATTYLQRLCDLNRSTLAEGGVLWPGSRAMYAAVADRLGRVDDPRAIEGSWDSLVAQVRAHDGITLLSNELLAARRRRPALRKLLADLPDTEVVITARDLVRVIPSQWRTGSENHQPTPWPEFIAALTADERSHPAVRWFWRRQDLAEIVGIWAELVGAERVTVVTVPPPGAADEVIAERLLSVMPFDPQGIDLDVDMSAAVRRNPPPTMSAEQESWARRAAQDQVARVERTGVAVVGSLADLAP